MRRAAVWLLPSVVAACAGALIAGAIAGTGDATRRITIAGLVCVFAIPLLLIGSLAIRALLRAWAPRTLTESWREDRGAMPRLAAWVGVVWLAILGLAWAMFQGTWFLANQTAFKPTAIGFAAPILAVIAVLVIVALSRPCADGFTWLARKIDRLWQRFLPGALRRVMPGSLLRPPIIFAGALITASGVFYLLWVLLIARRLHDPDVSLGLVLAPLAAIATTTIVHVAWRGRAIVRALAGGIVVVTAIASCAIAVRSVRKDPELALAIWTEHPIGRLAIDALFDIELIRRELPLDRVAPLPIRGAAHPDIVLVTLDGVRADRTPPHGGAAAMPALASLAEHGTLFRAAYSASPATQRSIPTLITGYGPQRVRGRITDAALELDVRHVAVAERLRAAGYETAVFACGTASFATRTGWTRGFETIELDDDVARLGVTAKLWLRKREEATGNRPLFVWLHLRPAHDAQIETVPSIDDRTKLYDQSLAKVDGALADAITPFGGRPPDRGPIVIAIGDRGEELGEHGEPFRADDLYDTLIHVPLVIAGPVVKAQSVSETVGSIDIAPTVLDLAGYQLPRDHPLDGRSLSELATGKRSGLPIYGQAVAIIIPDSRDTSRREISAANAIVRNNMKLIDNGGNVELYDLATDPGERTNLAGQRVSSVTELRALINQRLRTTSPPF